MARISDGNRYASVKSVNGADGISDMEGKVARVSDEGDGKRPRFKSVVKTAAWKFVSARAPRPGRRAASAHRNTEFSAARSAHRKPFGSKTKMRVRIDKSLPMFQKTPEASRT